MNDEIYNALSGLGYPVFLHGTLGADEPFPPTFVTYTTVDSPDAFQFDDNPTHTVWVYQIIIYSSDRHTLEQIAEASRTALRAAGFIPQGKGRDIPSEETTHTGWLCNYRLISNY